MFPIYARPGESMTARLVLEKAHKESPGSQELIWPVFVFTPVLYYGKLLMY